jgi:hypothetical protein
LHSGNARQRVEALKLTARDGLPLELTRMHLEQLAAGSIPERFWLARALKGTGDPDRRAMLTRMVFDPSLNVQYAAVRSLAAGACSRDLSALFREVLETSPEWYVQQNAYNAWRRCR